jgi:hypothetical protein
MAAARGADAARGRANSEVTLGESTPEVPVRRVASAAVVEIKELRDDLVGKSGAQVSMAFVLAVRSFTRWPVDAFVTHIDTSKEVQTIYWIQGNAIGRLTATGSGDTPTLSGAVHSLSSLASVDLGGTLVDERLGPPEVRRAATLRFGDGDEIAVDSAACTNQHCRDRTDEFINGVLDAIALDAIVFAGDDGDDDAYD